MCIQSYLWIASLLLPNMDLNSASQAQRAAQQASHQDQRCGQTGEREEGEYTTLGQYFYGKLSVFLWALQKITLLGCFAVEFIFDKEPTFLKRLD